MATLDSLPPDQRAVLQLVLQRGRSYDEIARLLSMDRAAVRDRALRAFDAMGPQTGVADLRRALITDYLLGQLPPAVAAEVRNHLGASPSERAWARVLASELAPLTSMTLPEIPVDGGRAAPGPPPPPAPTPGPAPEPQPSGRQSVLLRRRRQRAAAAQPEPQPSGRQSVLRRRKREREREAAAATESAARRVQTPPTMVPDVEDRPPRSSRTGGVILLLIAALVVVVVAVVALTSGSSTPAKKTPAVAAASSTTTAASSTTGTGSTAAKVVAQINLTPTKTGGKAEGVAEVLKEGANNGIAIVAQHVTPNSTKPPNAYAVWLYNSEHDAHILGFVNPGVSTNGRLSTAGGLPTNAAHYKQLVVTVETSAHPATPGAIILQGNLTGVS